MYVAPGWYNRRVIPSSCHHDSFRTYTRHESPKLVRPLRREPPLLAAGGYTEALSSATRTPKGPVLRPVIQNLLMV